jgi:hypothetical protein
LLNTLLDLLDLLFELLQYQIKPLRRHLHPLRKRRGSVRCRCICGRGCGVGRKPIALAWCGRQGIWHYQQGRKNSQCQQLTETGVRRSYRAIVHYIIRAINKLSKTQYYPTMLNDPLSWASRDEINR